MKLFYPGAGFDFGPIFPVGGHDEANRTKISSHAFDILKNVTRFVFADIAPQYECRTQTQFGIDKRRYGSVSMFIDALTVILSQYTTVKSRNINETSDMSGSVEWRCGQSVGEQDDDYTIIYFYGVDLMDDYPIELLNEVRDIDIFYQHGFMMDETEECLRRFTGQTSEPPIIIHSNANSVHPDEYDSESGSNGEIRHDKIRCSDHDDTISYNETHPDCQLICECQVTRLWQDQIHPDAIFVYVPDSFGVCLY